MSTERNHSLIGKDALELWGNGDLEGALARFSAAIDACPEGHWALFQYFGSRAGVLAGLGRRAEAEKDYERLVDHAREGGAPDASSDVAIARFFLGNHQLASGEFARALTTIDPSLDAGATLGGRLFVLKALALQGLGRTEPARAAADAATAAATSAAERAEIVERLGPLGDPPI